MDLDKKISDMNWDREKLLDYLHVKLAAQDWHGVRDCCADLEALDACIRLLTTLI